MILIVNKIILSHSAKLYKNNYIIKNYLNKSNWTTVNVYKCVYIYINSKISKTDQNKSTNVSVIYKICLKYTKNNINYNAYLDTTLNMDL